MTSNKCVCVCVRYFFVEEADPEDVLHAGRSVSHAQVPQGVPHQDDVGVVLQLLEVLGVPQSAVVFVVDVDQLTFEAPDDALRARGGQRRSEQLSPAQQTGRIPHLRCHQSP